MPCNNVVCSGVGSNDVHSMTESYADLVHALSGALFCGALVGMEREHAKGGTEKGPAQTPAAKTDEIAMETRHLAGIRTHILFALSGALGRILDLGFTGAPIFSVLGFAALAIFVVAAHTVRAIRTGHYGMTSVPTLLLTYGLGSLCCSNLRPVALALAVVIAWVLAKKAPLHKFVRGLTPNELTAAVKFGLLTLVLWPLLPDHEFGPRDWPALAERLTNWGMAPSTLDRLALVNPYQLWFLVVAISGLGFCAYVLVRILGAKRGLVLTGLAGGIVSSTSVTLAMAEQSRRTPQWKNSIVAAVLVACGVMTLRVLVVATALHAPLLRTLGLPIGAMLVANLALAFWMTRRGAGAGGGSSGPIVIATPLAIGSAVKLAGLIFLVRVLSEVAVLLIGDAGLLLMAGLSGLVDVDALTVAASQQAATARIGDAFAAAAIFVAVAVNTLVKAVLALTTADRAAGRATFQALLVTLAAGTLGCLGLLVWART